MKRILMIMVILIFSSPVYAFDESLTDAQIREWEKQCPHGDAVIQDKFNKNVEDVLVDCINYSFEKDSWITWTWNGKKKVYKTYPRSKYKAYTMDGLIRVHTKNGVIIIEEDPSTSDTLLPQ